MRSRSGTRSGPGSARDACARLLREETGIGRDILVDDLAGTVHRAYGLMPNMTWVIDRGGRAPRCADDGGEGSTV